jgi:hypothetical protein
MKHILRALLLCCLCPAFYAQEAKNAPESGGHRGISAGDDFVYRANQPGDRLFNVALMGKLPLSPPMKQLHGGGALALGYMRFIDGFVALGGEASFSYNATVGSNVFYAIPLVFKAAAEPVYRKFEFPLALGVGGAFEIYNGLLYFGFAVKPEAGVFYRLAHNWSLGVHGACTVMPQRYSDKTQNFTGVFIDAGLTLRYHF